MGTMDKIARDMREGTFPNKLELKVQGVGRMADNPRALLIILNGEPTDNEMRSLHNYLREWRPIDEQECPGHVGSKHDAKVCARCGVHIDSLRPD